MQIINKNILFGYEYDKKMDKSKRKANGSFYTPNFIVNYIIDKTIYEEQVLQNPFVKILDPCCGNGCFLIKVYEKLWNILFKNILLLKDKYKYVKYIKNNKVLTSDEYWREENLHYHIIRNCIFGADIDEEAVKFTIKNLSSRYEDGDIQPNILCCDSLIQWEKEYNEGEKFCFWNRKYDCIIGNPPWVSLNRKFGQINSMTKYYIDKYASNKYVPNLYEYFIKRSIEVLKDKGKIGFIVPDRFGKNLNLRDLRRSILERYNILNLVFEVKFPSVITDTMIFIIEKYYGEYNKINIDVYNKRSYFTYQYEYLNNPNFEFLYEVYRGNIAIKGKIEKQSVSLGDISTTFTGFIGEKNKITRSKVKNKQVLILKGENIKKFHISGNYYYELIPKNIKGGTQNLEKLKYPTKILVRKTGKQLVAALDINGCVIEQSLYGVIKLQRKFSYKYVLGILNSSLIQWYYTNFLVTNLNSTPQIKKCDLDRIPVKKCTYNEQKIIEDIVDNIMQIYDIEKIEILKNILNEEVFKLYNIDDEGKKRMGG